LHPVPYKMVTVAEMSLKAKLEAVIYAAEEPVTLAQLATLFADEALQWRAEQETARAVESAGDAGAENAVFDYADTDEGADSVTAAAAGDEVAEASNQPSAEDAAAQEAAAKRLARQRDREVRAILKQLLDGMIATYNSEGRGIEIREIAGGYRMATKPEFHDAVQSFVKSLKPPLKLSLQALETLAVVAYKQPVTGPEVNEIRGVDSSAVFGSLLARKLIVTAGRKQVIGRPILYKTTREFLLRFGLKDVGELPSMEEFEKMAASELNDAESTAEGESAIEISADLSLELDGPASEEPGETAEAE